MEGYEKQKKNEGGGGRGRTKGVAPGPVALK